MADRAEFGSLLAARRRPPAGRKSRHSQHKSSGSRVTLEKVLGISTVSSSGLTSDPNSGLIAYPAGCVVVLLNPKNNKQSHIINTSRKPFTALAFSHDGKHLVTGESGHMPCVRVWEVGGSEVAQVQSHKYGVSCVAFSSNSCYVVSVGYQHDMIVSVWDWRRGSIVASNKVSSRVFSISFSQDNSYFVTAGNRHVKFWYLDASKERRVNSTVPLIGRSGLLDDHKNSVFCGVACGRGHTASNTYCVTGSGLLCLFNSSRHLEAWVNLNTSAASCLAVSEDLVFCGCADGVVRVFRPSDLRYITTLQRPHCLGVDLTPSAQHRNPPPAGPGPRYPDTLALTFDPRGRHLTCVYSDHSVCVWDVKDVGSVKKLYSALYHSSCVWSVEVYPELQEVSQACLPPLSFLTCSSDNTIRLWHADPPAGHRNQYSQDLLKILYVGENKQHLQAEGERGEAAGADGKAGIRVLGVSPDGQHLAAGDRCGNLRIFDLQFLDELVKIEAHDSDVLCLEFSPPSSGVKLLASASRDRLIHIFNQEKNYSLEQTLNHHSASITAVKFTGESPEVRMVSCGADKSIYFQTAEQSADGWTFSRRHHVVEKTTLYDMDLDSSRTHAAIACQDRNVRVYDVETGKLKKCLKGSSSDEGALLKVQMDPSGSFFATSCSDKNITVFDYESGECVATLFGHSEIVTCMRFTQDCRRLISVSGDSCVFVWRLDSHMTSTMRKRRGLSVTSIPEASRCRSPAIRRETFTVPLVQLPQTEEEEQEAADLRTPGRPDLAPVTPLLQTNGKLPMWFRKLDQSKASSVVQSDGEPGQVRSRWAEQLEPLTICANFSPSPAGSDDEEDEEDFQPESIERLLGDEEEEEEEEVPGEDQSTFILHPNSSSAPSDRDFKVEDRGQGAEPVWRTHLSPDSACSEGSTGSVEQQQDGDTDSLSQGSSVGSLGPEEEEDGDALKSHFENLASSLSEERFQTDLTTLQPLEEKHFLNPRLSISTRFLSRFQDRLRARPVRAPPPGSIMNRICEESSIRSGRSCSVDSAGWTQSESCSSKEITSRTLTANRNTSETSAMQLSALKTSSRQSQDPPGSTSSSQENKENLPSSSEPRPSAAPLFSSGPDVHSLQVSARSTKVTSQSSCTEEPLTNQTLVQSPSPSTQPTMSAAVEGAEPGVTTVQPHPVSDVSSAADWSPPAPPSSCFPPLTDRLRPPQTDNSTCLTGEDEESVSEQQVADELRQAARRAVRLYQQNLQSSSVLWEAFSDVSTELQVAMLQDGGCGSSSFSGQLQDDGVKALLEKYSDLLVQMTQNKLNRM